MVAYRTNRSIAHARCYAATAVAVAVLAALPAFAGTIHSANSASTSMHGGNRELLSISFAGSPTVMAGSDFLRFNDGELYWGGSSPRTFGWTDAVPRDLNTSGNSFPFNPDRADGATSYLSEGASKGTLAEVFGPFNGYKNMSFLLDGEDASFAYHVDLLFADSFKLSGDALSDTVEIALLERGSNSDMNLYGILDGGGLTAPFKVVRNGSRSTLWNLDSLEIGGSQKVVGMGVSVDQSWQNLVGLRIESAASNFGGPDLIGVAAIPEPATMALFALGVGAVSLRRSARRA